MTHHTPQFDTLIKMAAESCLDKEVEEFDNIDISDISVSKKSKRAFNRALNIALLKDSKGYKIFKNTAIACLAAFVILLGAAVSIEPIRAYIWNIIITKYPCYFEVDFKSDDSADCSTEYDVVYLPKLPENWKIELASDTEASHSYYLSLSEDIKVLYTQSLMTSSILIDNTDYTVEEITINESDKAYLYTNKKGLKILLWQKDYVFKLQSSTATVDDLIMIAESIE